jgi:hypothetical protein
MANSKKKRGPNGVRKSGAKSKNQTVAKRGTPSKKPAAMKTAKAKSQNGSSWNTVNKTAQKLLQKGAIKTKNGKPAMRMTQVVLRKVKAGIVKAGKAKSPAFGTTKKSRTTSSSLLLKSSVKARTVAGKKKGAASAAPRKGAAMKAAPMKAAPMKRRKNIVRGTKMDNSRISLPGSNLFSVANGALKNGGEEILIYN